MNRSAMDVVSPVIDIVSRVWSCAANNSCYVCKLKKNLISLETSLAKLKEKRNDVVTAIDVAESNPTIPMKRTHVVSGWLDRVQALELLVDEILRQGKSYQQISEASCLFTSYFCCGRPKNCWTGHKIGKLVARNLASVEELRSERESILEVVDICQPDPVQEMPIDHVFGVDQMLEKIWRLVVEGDHVNVLGLYGMGGVGKTTLLKKLNNLFFERNLHDFDLVLWVVVSGNLDLGNIQKQIGDSLGLPWQGDGDLQRRANDIFKVLRKKKFVLLLDDLWQRVELLSIGIPPLGTTSTSSSSTTHGTSSSKVVFTTRSEALCDTMGADKKVKVECLNWDEAWTLFQEKVGQEALNCHPKVLKLAKQVAKECQGLPLALITIGRTMASKKNPQEWEHAVTVLKRSASKFSGMTHEVFEILKFSYDNLENEKIRNCFLYCSLYPEDYCISKKDLIDLWIGEGFIIEFDDIKDARNEGYDIITCLLSACLLETSVFRDERLVFDESEVKMHDVIRDLAIWIVSDDGRKPNKFWMVQPGAKEPKLDEWEKAEKVSLINNECEKLSKAPTCEDLSTLIIYNRGPLVISDDFFKFMPKLKVLSISTANVPTSITSLVELEYLKLPDNVHLGPGWLRSLLKLKYLDLSFTSYADYNITSGDISCLSNLQMLDTFDSSIRNWEVEGGPSLRELEELKHLSYLGITIRKFRALRTLVSCQKFHICTRRLYIRVKGWTNNVTSLALQSPSLPSSLSSFSLGNMINLTQLYLYGCKELEELKIRWVAEDEEEQTTLLTTLEILQIYNMPKLKIVWDIVLQPHRQMCGCFTNLEFVEINFCHAIKDVSWLIYAQGLKYLQLYEMDGLEEVISEGFAAPPMVNNNYSNTFSRLISLELQFLKNLKSICVHPLVFSSLETIDVFHCPQLKKLPLDANSAKNNTLRRIEMKTDDWENLEWEDETIKSTFAPYLRNP